MAFKFTPEDFDRYVRQEEHGGRHIWHEIQDDLELAFGIPFRAWPYNARGDRIAVLWFEPQVTPKRDWRYQAMFRFARVIENRAIGFGLKVERPPREYFTPGTKEYQDWDPNADWYRFEEKLISDPAFRELLDEILGTGDWTTYIRPWKTDIAVRTVASVADIESALAEIPSEEGIDFIMDRELSADEAIALGEGIVAHIVDTFTEIDAIWISLLPEPIQQSIVDAFKVLASTKGRQSSAYARRIIEGLLPDPNLRHKCLDLMADYIVQAHDVAEACWSITLFKDRVRLNIGRPQSFVIFAGSIYLLFSKGNISDRDVALLGETGSLKHGEYRSVPDAFDLAFEYQHVDDVAPIIRAGLVPFVETAAASSRVSTYRSSYSAGVIAYLREELGRDIPSPIFETESDEGHQSSLPIVNGIVDDMLQTVLSSGLHFTNWQLATFLTALQTKGFVILSGPTGTGKSKLAQHVASLLPRAATTSIDATGDTIVLTVQPYMLKYNRIIIPKASVRYFDPPEEGQSKEIAVRFDGKEQVCRFSHAKYPGTTYFQLLLRGHARKWFSDQFREDDRIRLQPQTDDEGALTGIDFIAEHAERRVLVDARKTIPNWLFVPVRPDWRDSKSLLGYYNPLSGDYVWTEFLRFVLRASENYASPDPTAWILILDEMNLARVEYYFADLLSILESGRQDDGWTRERLRFEYPEDASGELPPRELALPPNLYVIGTVNADETTHAFSPKVLDRAFTIELYDVHFDNYPPKASANAPIADTTRARFLSQFALHSRFHRVDKSSVSEILSANPLFRTHLTALNDILRPHDFQFGYRTFDEIMAFVHTASSTGAFAKLGGLNAAFDAAVLMKVLPKFQGTRSRLEQPLLDVLAWCRNPSAPDLQQPQTVSYVNNGGDSAQSKMPVSYHYEQTAKRIERMHRALHHSGFASFG